MPGHEHIPAMEQLKNEPSLPELSSQKVTMITTEHYHVHMGRAMTVADSNGRSTLFIGAVSGALITIAFTGQVSHMGTAFYVFSLVLLPSLFLMGLITFERVLHSAIEDLTYARGIMRIRHLYLHYAQELRPSFLLAADDERGRPRLNQGGLTPILVAGLPHDSRDDRRHQQCAGWGLCGPAALSFVHLVKAGAIVSRLRNDRPEKTNSKEQQSLNADRTAPGSPDPNADYRTPVACASVGLRATSR